MGSTWEIGGLARSFKHCTLASALNSHSRAGPFIMLNILGKRPEWKFFAVLPRADAGLAPGEVATWSDQGTAANDLAQDSALQQPTVVLDGTSRMPVVALDGVDDTLLFGSRLGSIRTVFWVIRRSPSMTPGYRMLLGDSVNYDFLGDTTTKLWSTSASVSVRNGVTRLNGEVVNGTATDRPGGLSVLSLVTTGSVKADAFSRDRTYNRSWWGDLAELVIYDRALSDAEVRSVEEYLAARYGIELAP